MLIQITSKYFCAGSKWKLRHDVWICYEAAPIIAWMVGKTNTFIKPYCAKKHWKVEVVK